MTPIPQTDPHAGYLAHREAIDRAVADALGAGRYILGPQVQRFERDFAAWLGAAACVGVASGTDALHLALRAAGVGPGDEVITVSHTAVATVAAIEMTGATPVLVDIEPAFFTLDPERLDAARTPRTKAIVPVHLYGQAADLDAILAFAARHGLAVIEDCAQAHGARWRGRRVGTFGQCGCFSFYPTKNLGAFGDGGAVVTNDPALAERVRLLREYGWKDRYVSAVPGFNSRLDELQAAVLNVRLPHLDTENARRAALARAYDAALAGTRLGAPAARTGAEHVYHQYVIRAPQRDRLRDDVKAEGIGTLIHYPVPAHRQPAYANRVPVPPGGLPVTERACGEILSLPMYPQLGDGDAARVCTVLRRLGMAT